MGAVAPGHVIGTGHGWNGESQRDLSASQYLRSVGLALVTAHSDVLQGIDHVQEEAALADGTTLVGILAGVDAACAQGVNGDGGATLAVVPQVVVGPARGGTGREGNSATTEHGGLDGFCIGTAEHCARNASLAGHCVGGSITGDSDGEGLLALLAVLGGVGDAIDVAAVGLYGQLASCLAGVPLPLSAVISSFGKLGYKRDVSTIGGYCFRRSGFVVILQSTQVGLIGECLALIDDVT